MSLNASISVMGMKVVIFVQDMRRAVVFYNQVLGLDIRIESDEWSEVEWKDFVIGLHAGGSGTRASTGISISVADAKASCEQVSSNGGQVLSPPVYRAEEKLKLATVCDTEGNEFMFVEYC